MVQIYKAANLPRVLQEFGVKRLSEEQFQNEVDYYRATVILQKILLKGLLTQEEFCKIDILNRESFSPMLASVMA